MCVVTRAYLDPRFFPVGGGEGRHAPARCASDEACTGIHVTQLLLHTGARHRMSRNISWVCSTGHAHAYWNGRGSSVWFVIPICLCIASESGMLFLYVRVFRRYSNPSSIYVPTLTPPSGVVAKKKNLRGKTLASPMIDATVVLVHE